MDKAMLQKSAEGYHVATVGSLDTFQGKAFVKDVLKMTSVEISFGSLAAGEALPFFHHHKQNEEVYIVLKGQGVFLLNGEEVEVSSGSMVQVAPQVSRSIRCCGQKAMVYICIQGKAGSLEQYTMTDGVIEQ